MEESTIGPIHQNIWMQCNCLETSINTQHFSLETTPTPASKLENNTNSYIQAHIPHRQLHPSLDTLLVLASKAPNLPGTCIKSSKHAQHLHQKHRTYLASTSKAWNFPTLALKPETYPAPASKPGTYPTPTFKAQNYLSTSLWVSNMPINCIKAIVPTLCCALDPWIKLIHFFTHFLP